MAEVWEAVDQRLDRPVAVKLFAGGAGDDATRARFLREARLAAQFAHPNAVTVYDTGEDNGALYLVMELVDGPTLGQVLAEQGALEPADAVDIADQILAAVGAGHGAGLVHRDIKPSNILFTTERTGRQGRRPTWANQPSADFAVQRPGGRAGSDPISRGPGGPSGWIVKLADFGIAKGVGEMANNLTAAGQVVGTPRYLSPEQAAGREATPASDLYAVGVVLYEMLCGAPPFVGDSPLATATAHRQAPVPSLAERRPGLAPGLVAVVERALAKAPGARFADATAMRRALAAPSVVPGVPAATTAGTDPASAGGPAAGTSPATAVGSATTVAAPTPAGTATAAGPALAETGVMQAAPRHAPPRPTASESGRARRASITVLATLGVLLVGAVATAALLMTSGGGGDDPAPQAAPDVAAPATATTAPPRATTTTTPPSTSTTAAPATPPPTIDGLAALLAGNPEAHGKKGADLLDKVLDLQGETAEKRAEEASKRLDDVSKWAEKGELDPETAQLATSVLQALAQR